MSAAAVDSGDRYPEAARCFRKAARFDNHGEYHQRMRWSVIYYLNCGKVIPGFPTKKYGALDYVLPVVIHDRSGKW
jgi:hypothetical protein